MYPVTSSPFSVFQPSLTAPPPSLRSTSPDNDNSEETAYTAPTSIAHHSLGEQIQEKFIELNDSISRMLGQAPIETALETAQDNLIHFMA